MEKFPVLDLGVVSRFASTPIPMMTSHSEKNEGNMREYVENMKEYVKNIKKYVENMKEYERNMTIYEEICRKHVGVGRKYDDV